MDRLEQAALLALLRDREGGWGLVAESVEGCGSALKVLEAEVGAGQADLFGPDASQQVEMRIEAALLAIDAWVAEGLTGDPVGRRVPLPSRHGPSAATLPALPGRVARSGPRRRAVVGTREPSEEGVQRASAIASGLAHRGVTLSVVWQRASTRLRTRLLLP